MRRLSPNPADHVPPFAAGVDPNRRRHPDGRPWIGICMIASLDGATAVDGRSGGLSSDTDHQLLLALRATADVVMVGAGTVRAEGYGPPRKAGLKIGVVSSRGDGLDFGAPLFSSGAGFLITTTDAPDVPVNAIRAGTGQVDLARAVRRLGATFVHVEGGPRLNAALLDAGLVDEVNLTLSPHLAGGDSPRVTAGAASTLQRMRLAHVLEDDGFVFCRYLRTE